jgi:hypothetical protein
MKTWIFVVTGMVMGTAYAQNVSVPSQKSYLHNYNIVERLGSNQLASQSGIIPGIAAPPPEVQGDFYLHPDYRITTFQLYASEKLVEGFTARFDIHSNEFDLITKQGIRALRGDLVKSIVWLDSVSMQPQYLVNGKEFVNEANIPYTGFFQILAQGKMFLLKKTELQVKEPDYHVALNVGSRDTRITKKHFLYYTVGNQALPWPGKKQGLKIFSDKAKEVNEFIKVNELDLSKEGHLRALVDYYNSITN